VYFLSHAIESFWLRLKFYECWNISSLSGDSFFMPPPVVIITYRYLTASKPSVMPQQLLRSISAEPSETTCHHSDGKLSHLARRIWISAADVSSLHSFSCTKCDLRPGCHRMCDLAVTGLCMIITARLVSVALSCQGASSWFFTYQQLFAGTLQYRIQIHV